MFTGLVQQTGRLERLSRVQGGWRAEVGHAPWPDPLLVGESVAVQGACLTVVACRAGSFAADLLDETYGRTAFAALPAGAAVNLERALRLGDRLGGHLVSGHIDETGRLRGIEPRGRDFALAIACSPGLARLVVHKGSIAIDGVSLTVTEVADDGFAVQIIPHTLRETSLRERRPGDALNLEADILAKHVARLLGPGVSAPAAAGGLDLETLVRAGFGG